MRRMSSVPARYALLALLVWLVVVSAMASAEEINLQNQSSASMDRGAGAARAHPAPGGGEMLFLPSVREHVARAQVDDDGTVSVHCEHTDVQEDAHERARVK